MCISAEHLALWLISLSYDPTRLEGCKEEHTATRGVEGCRSSGGCGASSGTRICGLCVTFTKRYTNPKGYWLADACNVLYYSIVEFVVWELAVLSWLL